MIISMKKLEVILLKQHLEKILTELQKLGYCSLESVPLHRNEKSYLTRMHLSENEDEQKNILHEITKISKELEAILNIPIQKLSSDESKELKEIQSLSLENKLAILMKYRRQLKSLTRKQCNIQDNSKTLKKYKNIAPFIKSLSLDETTCSVHTFSFPTAEDSVKEVLNEEIKKLQSPLKQLQFFKLNKIKTIGIIVVPKEFSKTVKKLTWKAGAIDFVLPPAYRHKTLVESFKLIDKELKSLPGKISKIDSQIKSVSKSCAQSLSVIKEACFLEEQRLNSLKNFVSGKYIHAVHIWVPHDKVKHVMSIINEITDKACSISEIEKNYKPEDVPVNLKNNSYSKPFEVLLKIFPPPTYKSFDPTFINSISLPLFYGVIVGDIAYGLIIFIIMFWLKKTFKHNNMIQAVGQIGYYCAISTIIFGAIFSEFFGDFGHHSLHMWQPLINREKSESIIFMMLLTGCIGFFHITIAICLGIYNGLQLKDKHLYKERLGQLLFAIALAFFVIGLFTQISILILPGILFFMASFIVLIFGAGPLSILELVGLITNILSYTRLMALGVASIVVAKVANVIFSKLNTSASGFITGLIVAVFLHGLNVILSMFSPTVHSLRLHYVEYFTKFYQSEGKTFTPFGKIK